MFFTESAAETFRQEVNNHMTKILQRLEDEQYKIFYPMPEAVSLMMISKTTEAAFPRAGSLTTTQRGT